MTADTVSSHDELQDDSGDPVPSVGLLLGLDYGTKRVGVAMCNEEQTMALPLENYELRTRKLDAEWLLQLAHGYGARGLVVGLPVHMSGDEGGKALEAREFGRWAAKVTSLPVAWWDERFSSATADVWLNQSAAKKKQRTGRRDQLAAQVILQAFLDAPDRNARPLAFDSDGD